MRPYFLALVGILLLSICLAKKNPAIADETLSPEPIRTLHFTRYQDNSDIVIPVEINGHTYPFVLDTGCEAHIILRPWVAKKLDLPIISTKATLATTRPLPLSATILAKFRHPFCDVQLPYILAFVGNIKQLSGKSEQDGRIAGVIGAPLLDNLITQFDFFANTIRIFSRLPPLRAGAAILPLKSPKQDRYFVDVEPIKGHPLRWLLDTGADATSLPYRILEGLQTAGFRPTLQQTVDDTACWTFEALFDKITIGTLTEPNVALTIEPPGEEAGLGMDLLSRFRVTLDLPGKRLILEPGEESSKKTPLRGIVLMKLFRQGKTILVTEVEPGSNAALAGLQRRDVLLEVEGKPVENLSLENVCGLLAGEAGEKITLTLLRKGERFVVSLVRQHDYLPFRKLTDGVIIQKVQGKSLRVLAVVKGCRAEKASLKAGFLITHLNGQPTAKMSVKQIDALWDSGPLKIKAIPGKP